MRRSRGGIQWIAVGGLSLALLGAPEAGAAFLPISVARKVTYDYAREFFLESSISTGYRVGGCHRAVPYKVTCQAVVHVKKRGLVGESGDCFYPIEVKRTGGTVKSRWNGGMSGSGTGVNCFP